MKILIRILAVMMLAMPAVAQTTLNMGAFPGASGVNPSDIFLVTQGYTGAGTGTTRKASASQMQGYIQGTLSDMMDARLGTATGGVACRSTGAWTECGPGTSGYVLTSNGTGAVPTFQAVPGGSLATLSDVTLSSPTTGQALTYNAGTDRWVNTTVTSPPGGSSGQVQYNNSGAFGGFTVGGDCTLNTGTGTITCTKTNGTSYAIIATSGSASDLGSGTVPIARIPTGTTSSTVVVGNDSRITTAPFRFSFSGATAIAASVPIVAVIGEVNGISIAANPNWFSWCDTLPTASTSYVLKQLHSGATTSIGNITIGTGGTVTASPSWSAVTLAQGDAIIVTSPSTPDATANGCGLVVSGTKL